MAKKAAKRLKKSKKIGSVKPLSGDAYRVVPLPGDSYRITQVMPGVFKP